MSSKMYNLNVPSSGGDGSTLTVPQTGSPTPRTPEVLNTLMAMTNPFDGYNSTDPKLASSPPGDSDIGTNSGSSVGISSPVNPVSSVQRTRSLLIKEGLKLTIQAKRGSTSSQSSTSDPNNDAVQERVGPAFQRDDFSMDSIGSDEADDGLSSNAGDRILTMEDEERRRKRRERNKIAATKCRQKKRARTNRLVQESEVLENQNLDLKSEIQKLELERQQLVEMLSVHQTHCKKGQQVPPYNEEDFTNPSTEFISTDLTSTSFQPSGKALTNPLTAHPIPDYRKHSSARRIGYRKSAVVGTPSSTTTVLPSESSSSPSSSYQMDTYSLESTYPPSESSALRRVDPSYADCYSGSNSTAIYPQFNSSEVKPPLSVTPMYNSASSDYQYDRSRTSFHDCQTGTNSSYNLQNYQPHQSPYIHSDVNDNNIELINPSSTGTSSFTDYSTSDSVNFSHFPIPCISSPSEEYSKNDPRYNCCSYEIN